MAVDAAAGVPVTLGRTSQSIAQSVQAMPRVAGCNVFVTLKCNLDCPYCYVAKDGSHMSLETADQVVDLMAGFARHRDGQFHFGFLGGEPLLQFDTIRYMVREMRSRSGRDIAFGLTTNGTVFNDAMLEWLAHNDIRVVLSFDGVPAAMAGRPVKTSGRNSYDRVVQGMKALQAAGVRHLVQMTLTGDNVRHFADSVRHTIELGNQNLIFGFSLSDTWTVPQRDLLVEQLRQVFDLYVEIYRAGGGTVFKFVRDEITSYLLYGLTREPEHCCSMADQVLAVSVDGQLVPCQAFVNFSDQAFGDIRHGVDPGRLETLRRGNVSELEHCNACLLKGFCRKCPAANYAISGDVNAVTPISCSLAHITYGLVERFVDLMVAEQNPRFLDEFQHELAARRSEQTGVRRPLSGEHHLVDMPLDVAASTSWDWDSPALGLAPRPTLPDIRIPQYAGRPDAMMSVGDGRAPILEFGAYRIIEMETTDER